jgi:hypothetical protein
LRTARSILGEGRVNDGKLRGERGRGTTSPIVRIRMIAVTETSCRTSTLEQRTSAGTRTMMFDLVRAGWPNTAAIAALAVMPLVALMLSLKVPDKHPMVASSYEYTYYYSLVEIRPFTE